MKESTMSKVIKRVPQTSLAVVSLLLFYLLLPQPSRADSPMEQVRATVDKVLTIVRSPNPKSNAQIEAQRAQLLEVIYPSLITVVVSRHW